MSANNMYYALEKEGKWYGWCVNAEASDDIGEYPVFMHEATIGSSLEDLEDALNNAWGYAEYGITTKPYLAKDGTKIVVKDHVAYPRLEVTTPQMSEDGKDVIIRATANVSKYAQQMAKQLSERVDKEMKKEAKKLGLNILTDKELKGMLLELFIKIESLIGEDENLDEATFEGELGEYLRGQKGLLTQYQLARNRLRSEIRESLNKLKEETWAKIKS